MPRTSDLISPNFLHELESVDILSEFELDEHDWLLFIKSIASTQLPKVSDNSVVFSNSIFSLLCKDWKINYIYKVIH